MSNAKKPADHQRKATKRLQDEVGGAPELENLTSAPITVSGRAGAVDVTVLDDPMEWEAESIGLLDAWAVRGGVKPGEVIPFLKGIVSAEDGLRIDAVRPTLASALAIVEVLMGSASESDLLETVGESQAS